MHKHAVILLLLIAIEVYLSSANTSKCSRMPEGTSSTKSPPDGRFRLRIINDPIRFIPGESYNISLEGVTRHSAISPQKFIGFFLTVERNDDKYYEDNDDLGRFQILQPAISKISEKCNNLVVNTNTGAKPEVLIQWTAPSKLKGCIVFRSTIVEHRDIWFMDDGALSKTLCEDEADSFDLQPLILPECKACDEAKYELTFEGLWTRNTHPKDFPDDGWLTKFSDVIGASHAIENSFWRYGDQSTQGMKDMAEHGATKGLEDELKEKGEVIRTIIKARGISYPNINGRTFAVFRADAQHHLLSLVSKIYPSPDWFVGVSDLELCLENGQWVESKEINLYPYDAGTDSGATYTSPDQPTLPLEAIRRIKPNNPNDPRSPFYDVENKEMKPLAKLYITRQRLYEKACDNSEAQSGEDEENSREDENGDNDYGNSHSSSNKQQYCDTYDWSRWSECNNPCGDGQRIRTRYYKNPQMASKSGCRETLEERDDCVGTRCPNQARENNRNVNTNTNDFDNRGGAGQRGGGESAEDDDLEAQLENDPECELTDWVEDESCSCDGGQGQKKLKREFRRKDKRKVCMKKYRTVELEKFENCEPQDCDGDRSDSTTMKIGANCPTSTWSKWSKCTASCGRGQKISVRRPNKNVNTNDQTKEISDLYNKLQSGSYNRDELLSLEIVSVTDSEHPCYGVQLVNAEPCGQQNDQCESNPSYFCKQPPMRGNCGQPPEIRFYYSVKQQKCGIYFYTGCGERSFFTNYTECQTYCEKPFNDEDDSRPNSHALVNYDLLKEKINCEVTQWKYTPCNATCGEGYHLKYRQIIRRAENGGKACPTKLRQLEKCRVNDDCEPVRVYRPASPQPPVRTTTQRTATIYCEYSEWSSWSPCSKTCGHSAIQIRTRSVLNYENSAYCIERLQEQACPVLPCLVETYNYRRRTYN